MWDPAAQTDIDRLQAVQRTAARLAPDWHQKTASVKLMVQELYWPSLDQPRGTARLGMPYKVNSGLAAVTCRLLKKQPQRARTTHTSTFERIPCRADYRLNSFFPGTVMDWNTLPSETLSAPSNGAFISRAAKFQ